MLTELSDPFVAQAAPIRDTGRKWSLSEATQWANVSLVLRNILAGVQQGRSCLGLGLAYQSGRMFLLSEVQAHGARNMSARGGGKVYNGCGSGKARVIMRWEGVEKRKIS